MKKLVMNLGHDWVYTLQKKSGIASINFYLLLRLKSKGSRNTFFVLFPFSFKIERRSTYIGLSICCNPAGVS